MRPSDYLNPQQHRPGIAIASISRLRHLCEAVIPRYSDHARIFPVRKGYGDAVSALEPMIEAGTVDIILAAGSNGAYLRERLNVPVVMVKVNGFDVMRAIAEATSQRPGQSIGLILHESVSSELGLLRPWLATDIFQRAYRSTDEVHREVEALVAQGCGTIIGPGMACDLADQAGVPSVFLYSLGAVEEAFERSLELARVSREKESKNARTNTIVAHLRDGVAAFDDVGRLEVVNPAMRSLLGLHLKEEVPAELHERVSALLRDSLVRGTPVLEHIEHIDGRALSFDCVPIYEHGARAGTVISAQDAVVAQRIDRSLRTTSRPKHLQVQHRLEDLVGGSAQMCKVLRLARKSALYDVTVLLTGESGTGKELVAQGIHSASKRSGNPFVAFNCAALPEGLIESELFGHDEGAFTGARRGGKQGLFEMAHTGTILLDEIGEMPLALQSRLLRVLQERQVMRLGSGRPVPIDVRVIAATHRDLRALVKQGAFRADLYFRLNVLQIPLPTLRERRVDIPKLAKHLLEGIVTEYHVSPAISGEILNVLDPLFRDYQWPGNVRELVNVLVRSAIHHDELKLGLSDDVSTLFPEFGWIGESFSSPMPSSPKASVTREQALLALEAAGGNRSLAAKALGVSRTTFWRLTRDE